MSAKAALVTGASSGIGKAVAERLLKDGYAVYVAARRVDQMADLEKQGAIALKMDITKEEDVQAVVERITADHGGLDVLVNNAGFGLYGAIEDVSIEDARYQFEVNLFGLARLTQLLLPGMRERAATSRAGRIFNISSVGGKIYMPLGGWYHATKHALEGFSDSLRMELEPHGIDVVIIEPGLILTEFGDHITKPVLERSGNGAYADLAQGMAASISNAYERSDGSPPSVIADVIAKAIAASRPKTRYAAGKMAKMLLRSRALMSDRMFDGVVRKELEKLRKKAA